MNNSSKYQIPADLAASIYDIALSEGIDPALGFQLVKIESNFKEDARSSMGALGYTQVQMTTARFYEPELTEKELFERETNLRIGFRFLNDLLEQFDHDTHLALLAYNRGPTQGEPRSWRPAATPRTAIPPRCSRATPPPRPPSPAGASRESGARRRP